MALRLHEGLGQHMVGLLLTARAHETRLLRGSLEKEAAEATFLVAQLEIAREDFSNLRSWLDEGRLR